MPDMEKVLTWLEICGKDNHCSGCCPYSENGFGEYGQCRESLIADAYDLLKEQEVKIEQLNRFINGFSRDAIHVVRCKDCIFPKNGICHNAKTFGAIVKDDWFCADGKHK